jgi:hypothetical protein
MQSNFVCQSIRIVLICGLTVALFGQQPSKPNMTIQGAPSEPVATGACTSTTFGYIELNGKTAEFTDAEFGQMIMQSVFSVAARRTNALGSDGSRPPRRCAKNALHYVVNHIRPRNRREICPSSPRSAQSSISARQD